MNTMNNRARMRDRHQGRDWHDNRVAEAEAVARVLGGVDIDRIHRRSGSRDWLHTVPACHGPCDQGRKLCPCQAACAAIDAEDEQRNVQPLHRYALDALRDVPAGIGVALSLVGGIVAIVLGLHAWLT